MAQKKDLHVAFLLKYVLRASALNKTPPRGEPNPAETPADADADNISLFFPSLPLYFGNCRAKIFPQQQEICIKGPRDPRHNPDASVRICLKNIQKSIH
jgi:hypothetical protein